ncbi:PI-PLC X domain-containing protein [Termitomyces sp. J132]|nr:hypothetical protein H2248_001083 [Termitomyces sp. 'cryptogamus']KNZ74158.1 PI-PLC X domain-containing protein [Termitomyces sp. J132]
MLLSRKTLTQVVTSLLCSIVAVQGMVPVRRATVCNGHAELCDKSYGAVSYIGSHDSYAIQIGASTNPAANQDQNITTQLNDGIRMLQVQAHLQNGVIRLCHTSCTLLDGGTFEDYLKTVKAWLDANPNEVLSILIVNIDNQPVSAFGSVYVNAGIDTVSYAPPKSPMQASEWPTLGSMIDSGKRLVTFMDNQADLTTVPYIIDEFTNVWETAFDVTDPSLFDCAVNRTKGDTSTQMYLINHFLDKLLVGAPIPDVAKANITNAASGAGSLGEQVTTCTSVNTRPPNFLLVDFYEFGGGSVFQVAATINGVTYAPTTPIATPLPTTTTSGSSSVSSGTGQGGASLNMFIMEFMLLATGIIFRAYAAI